MQINGTEIDPVPIAEFIKSGEKIKAIQYVMLQAGVSLKEAKEAIEIESGKIDSLALPIFSPGSPMVYGTRNLKFKYQKWYSNISGIITDRISAGIIEKDGVAMFKSTMLELVLGKHNIPIQYRDILKIEYYKVVGSIDTWSFLPIGKLTIHLKNGRKIKIDSSRHEARKIKREHGLLWKYRLTKNGAAPVPDVQLWQVCSELSKRSGQPVCVDRVIESSG